MTSARDRKPVSMNMTPMIDVVFLLIIFFLVSSHLAQQEVQPDLKLPTAASGGLAPPSATRVTVNLRADGQLLLGSDPVTAEQLGRRCYAMEIEPKYVQVAKERWEAFTGSEATRG